MKFVDAFVSKLFLMELLCPCILLVTHKQSFLGISISLGVPEIFGFFRSYLDIFRWFSGGKQHQNLLCSATKGLIKGENAVDLL
jgi:hypothetical protein